MTRFVVVNKDFRTNKFQEEIFYILLIQLKNNLCHKNFIASIVVRLHQACQV